VSDAVVEETRTEVSVEEVTERRYRCAVCDMVYNPDHIISIGLDRDRVDTSDGMFTDSTQPRAERYICEHCVDGLFDYEPDGDSLLRRVLGVVTLPAVVAHELTHLIAAVPWSQSAGVVIADGAAECQIRWRDDPPTIGVILAAYAPTVVGCVLGVGGLVALATDRPDTAAEWLWAAAAAGYWIIYVLPSAFDREVAAQAHQQPDADTNT